MVNYLEYIVGCVFNEYLDVGFGCKFKLRRCLRRWHLL